MADNTSTRRKVLGAIAGIPAVAIVASGGCAKLGHAAPRSAWDIAMQRFLDAEEALRRYDAAYCYVPYHLPVGPARNAAVASIPKECWEEAERLQAISSNLEACLLKMPAPDHKALLWKLERALVEDEADPGQIAAFSIKWLGETFNDMRRLLA